MARKPKKTIASFAIAFPLLLASTSLLSACGNSGESNSSESSAPAIEADEYKRQKNEFEEARNQAIEKIKSFTEQQIGFLSEEQFSSILFKGKLYSEVEPTNYDQLMISRNVCKDFSYVTLIDSLVPSEGTTTELRHKDFFNQSTPLTSGFTYFWAQFPQKLSELQRKLSNAVLKYGDSCSAKLRLGLTSKCEKSIDPRIKGWYTEEDLNNAGCKLGNNVVDVRSYVEPIDDVYFPGSFYLMQLSSKPGEFAVIRIVQFFLAPALDALLLNEFMLSKDERPSAGKFNSVMDSMASKAAIIAAEIRMNWLEKLDSDIGYKKLAAKHAVLATLSPDE